jgi:hypothetical protein
VKDTTIDYEEGGAGPGLGSSETEPTRRSGAEVHLVPISMKLPEGVRPELPYVGQIPEDP